jgi:hypothetical protein
MFLGVNKLPQRLGCGTFSSISHSVRLEVDYVACFFTFQSCDGCVQEKEIYNVGLNGKLNSSVNNLNFGEQEQRSNPRVYFSVSKTRNTQVIDVCKLKSSNYWRMDIK